MAPEETIIKIDQSEETEKSAAGGRNFMYELSPDTQTLISSFLYAGDSIIFRHCISKSLTSNLISSPISRRMMNIEPHPLPQFPELPYLLSLQDDNVLKFYHPLLSGFYSMRVSELSEARIRFSSHGWLLMHNDDGNIFFFEPISKQKIVLPNRPAMVGFEAMCFNSPPTFPNCFVMALEFGAKEYYIVRRGEESWTMHSLSNGFLFCIGVPPVMRDGLCYCLGNDGNLGVFNPEEKNPNNNWTICGEKWSKKMVKSVRLCFLLEKNKKELLRVLVVGDDRRIEFSTFNIRTKTWSTDPEESLGDKMLFLSSKGSFSESSDLRGMHNKIYFPKFRNDANIFYSISAKRYLSFHDDYSSKSCHGGDVKDLSSNCVWFKPVFSGTTFCDESLIKW